MTDPLRILAAVLLLVLVVTYAAAALHITRERNRTLRRHRHAASLANAARLERELATGIVDEPGLGENIVREPTPRRVPYVPPEARERFDRVLHEVLDLDE